MRLIMKNMFIWEYWVYRDFDLELRDFVMFFILMKWYFIYYRDRKLYMIY